MTGKLFIYKQKIKLSMKYINNSVNRIFANQHGKKTTHTAVDLSNYSNYIQTPLQ